MTRMKFDSTDAAIQYLMDQLTLVVEHTNKLVDRADGLQMALMASEAWADGLDPSMADAKREYFANYSRKIKETKPGKPDLLRAFDLLAMPENFSGPADEAVKKAIFEVIEGGLSKDKD